MAILPLTLVRKRIGDDTKTETETFTIGADINTVRLAYSNANLFSVYDKSRSANPLTSPVDYSFDEVTNTVSLTYVPVEESVLSVVYTYYAFSDDDLNDLIAAYGVNGACIEAIRWLIADASRLHDYSRGATNESLSQITKNLQAMLAEYQKSLGNDTSGNPAPDMKIMKRTNQWYRGTTNLTTDLSRDDSLNL